MILEEETFKEFGYYPKELKSESNKRILTKCNECGEIREIRRQAYHDLCKSCAHIGKHHSEKTKLKMSKAQKGDKSYMYGRQCSGETKLKMSIAKKRDAMYGMANPAWRGGISFEPYCIFFNDGFKERVREYWNRKCMVCGKTEKEIMEEMKKEGKRAFRLSVHHVTYNKETCCDVSFPLFVALCIKCHRKTHNNEEYWIQEFKRIIYSQNINGKCFYTKEEMEGLKMTKVEFDSVNHKYYIDEIEFPSVTTILNILDKSAPLMQWSANVALQYIKEHMDELHTKTSGQILYAAKQEHKRIKNAAASVGTRTHRLVEDYLIANKYKSNPSRNELILSGISEDLKKPFYAFLDWIEDKNFVLSDVEKIIYSKKLRYAGTLDIRCLLNGRKYIIDLKTSSCIYEEMLLQLSGYKNAYEEINIDRGHRVGILRLDKITGEPEWKEYTNKEYLKALKLFKLLSKYWHLKNER